MTVRTLIIEDDAVYARLLWRIAEEEGFQITVAGSGEDGLMLLDDVQPAVVLCDLGLPGMNGIQVLEEITRRSPGVISIVVSGMATIETAVAAMRAGAFDIIQKTGDVDEIQFRLKKAFETASLRQQIEYFTRREKNFGEIIGESEPMMQVKRRIEEVAAAPTATVLVVGETGTGKELVARAVHNLSVRQDKPLISINCAAVPDNLIESEFFGHERGAFTGAERARTGLFETATGSSLFLDEIGELDLKLQAKLLRVLEERVLKRVGGSREIKVDVRLILATNRALEQEVAKGCFREDLLYRVNVFRIDVPPLRDRNNDVLILARHFMLDFSKQLAKKVNVITSETEQKLLSYNFPGNVRQLRNMMEQAVILAKSNKLTPDLFPGISTGGNDSTTTVSIRREMDTAASPISDRMTLIEKRRGELDGYEKELIMEAIGTVNGNKTKSAKLLGMSRFALQRRLKRHDI